MVIVIVAQWDLLPACHLTFGLVPQTAAGSGGGGPCCRGDGQEGGGRGRPAAGGGTLGPDSPALASASAGTERTVSGSVPVRCVERRRRLVLNTGFVFTYRLPNILEEEAEDEPE